MARCMALLVRVTTTRARAHWPQLANAHQQTRKHPHTTTLLTHTHTHTHTHTTRARLLFLSLLAQAKEEKSHGRTCSTGAFGFRKAVSNTPPSPHGSLHPCTTPPLKLTTASTTHTHTLSLDLSLSLSLPLSAKHTGVRRAGCKRSSFLHQSTSSCR